MEPTTPQPAPQPTNGTNGDVQPTVHVSRPIAPEVQEVPPEIQRLHDESARKYPRLNLSQGEFVISAVRRHPIGVIKIWAIIAFVIGVMGLLVMALAPDLAGEDGANISSVSIYGSYIFISVLVFLGGIASTFIYDNNRFYLTNESVIQEIQTSLFSRNEQTVSLANIEDASFVKGGIIPTILNYGGIRLSTEGDETTYRFNYVSNPKREVAILNNAVEAFKNGRPVLPNSEED